MALLQSASYGHRQVHRYAYQAALIAKYVDDDEVYVLAHCDHMHGTSEEAVKCAERNLSVQVHAPVV